jgi:hypothetical protein
MAKLYGAQKMVLQAIMNAQGEASSYIDDSKLARETQIALSDMRNWLLTLDHEEYVDLALTNSGLSASITPKGRLTLGMFRPIATTPARVQESPPPRLKTGGEKALVIGVSDYPSPIAKLPAVANDVREIAGLLSSEKGEFTSQNLKCLVDGAVTQQSVRETLGGTFRDVGTDDPVFVYIAGHGAVMNDDYFFVAHDTKADRLDTTGVPLREIKESFDASLSQRAFLWLDFCHSGGILSRDLGGAPDDRTVIERTLNVVQGQGKLILAACTPSQSAWESAAVGHGLFTDALLRGLKGEAATGGEVTINSLFDYIDRQMGSDRQRPMMFGQMTGRVVLIHAK